MIGGNTFTDERRFSTDMVALLDKITLVQDASISKDTRRMQVVIDVTLGFLLKAFKGTMTGHINDNLDKLFGAAGAAPAPAAAKAPAKKAKGK